MPDPRRLSYLAATALAAAAFFGRTDAAAQDRVTAYAVVDSASGHVLMAQAPNKKLDIGSLTNIATGMVVLDWLEYRKKDLGEMVTIPSEALSFPQNPIGFQPSDQVSIRDLLYAALMQSDDIAAYVLAEHVGEDLPPATRDETPEDRFVAQMNALARKLGMRSTIFVNATGIENGERRLPYSTAGDMALLARYAMNRSQFRFYVSQKQRDITLNHPMANSTGYVLQNTNDLLGVDAIDGVRTGMSQRVGPCVILSAARAPESVQQGENYIITPRRLVVVVLGAADRFGLGDQLLRNGWAAYDDWAAKGRPNGRN